MRDRAASGDARGHHCQTWFAGGWASCSFPRGSSLLSCTRWVEGRWFDSVCGSLIDGAAVHAAALFVVTLSPCGSSGCCCGTTPLPSFWCSDLQSLDGPTLFVPPTFPPSSGTANPSWLPVQSCLTTSFPPVTKTKSRGLFGVSSGNCASGGTRLTNSPFRFLPTRCRAPTLR